MSIDFDSYEDFDAVPPVKNTVKMTKPQFRPTRAPAPDEDHYRQAQDNARGTFNFTYKAARFEAGWLLDSLSNFYEHHWIADVLRRIKGGKEASVYLCRAGEAIPGGGLVAAKVYRPRMLRNLKNDAIYREGRADLNEEGSTLFKDADVHAMEKRSSYGEELRHTSWIAHEFTILQTLHAAGADVPEAFAMAKNAILMGYVGALGASAPALNEVALEREEVRPLFERVIRNIDIMLGAHTIHADLSAYNILYWDGHITLIDFPQVVPPEGNRNAFKIFERDVTRVCEYFAKQGYHANPRKIAADLWAKHGYKSKPEVDIRLLDAEDPKDRALWKRTSA
jgi:RIO kinase 1